jgi:DNA-binding NarL/FixJ family response regulator
MDPKPETAPKHRIFLVEDHPMFRKAVGDWLRNEPDLEVVGEASSCGSTLAALRQTQVDAVVVDLTLEGTDGLELIKHLRAEHPDLRILVLSMHDEEAYAMRALRAGAHGYVMKRAPGEAFMQALRQILRGEVYVSDSFGKKLIFRALQADALNLNDPLANISDRELEVLRLLGQGRSTREIATHLHLSVKTVESHRLNLRDKLGLTTSAELVRFALDWHAGSAAPG